MGLKLFLSFLLVLPAMGQIRIDGGGGYEEALMSGTGMARLGSTAGMATNPGLLGFMPAPPTFTSNNMLLFMRDHRNTSSLSVDPTYLPIFASMTSREGDWGRAFGITAQDIRLGFESGDGVRTKGDYRITKLSLSGAVGKRHGQWGWGAGATLVRDGSELSYTYDGTQDGDYLVGSLRERTAVWGGEVALGAAGKSTSFLSWGFKASVIPVVWGGSGRRTGSLYSQNASQSFPQNESFPPVMGRPLVLEGGIRAATGVDTYFSMDLEWISESDTNGGRDRGGAQASGGLEQRVGEKLWGYAGLMAVEGSRVDLDDGLADKYPASIGGSFGIKRIHNTSSTLYGITYSRDWEYVGTEAIGFIFGTRFKY